MAFNMAPLKALLAILILITNVTAKVTVLENALQNGTVTDETVSGSGSLDGVKLSGTANETTYEWWYFDVVSTSSKNESVNVVFYNAGPEGFPTGSTTGPLLVSISGSFANGSTFSVDIPATQAVFNETENGLSADYKGAGASFFSTSLLHPKVYHEISLDSPEKGVSGNIGFFSKAPARYPCGPNVPGQNELAFLNVGWANAVPDSDAIVQLNIGDTPVHFKGLGYHDQNWGISPFTADVAHTYWGHARIGPYSIVFSDGLVPAGPNGTLVEKLSGTVARNGELLAVSCAADAAVVRPWGENAEYPPTIATPPPTGIEISIDLGGKEGVLHFNVTNELVVEDNGVYQRIIGTVKGGKTGCAQYEGRVLYEQFKLIPPGTMKARSCPTCI